jgi:hypothetical protein
LRSCAPNARHSRVGLATRREAKRKTEETERKRTVRVQVARSTQ